MCALKEVLAYQWAPSRYDVEDTRAEHTHFQHIICLQFDDAPSSFSDYVLRCQFLVYFAWMEAVQSLVLSRHTLVADPYLQHGY